MSALPPIATEKTDIAGSNRGQSIFCSAPCRSNVNLLRNGEGIVYVDAKMPYSALYLRMAEQKLNGSQIPGSAVDEHPLAARAQQPTRIRRVGVLMNLSENDVEAQRLITAFREGLMQLGWVDGRNLRIDYRWAGGDIGRIRAFAKELVELSPDIIVAYATPSVVALQQQTQSVPIVFLSVTDPVGQGLVSSLANPGGNITGLIMLYRGF